MHFDTPNKRSIRLKDVCGPLPCLYSHFQGMEKILFGLINITSYADDLGICLYREEICDVRFDTTQCTGFQQRIH